MQKSQQWACVVLSKVQLVGREGCRPEGGPHCKLYSELHAHCPLSSMLTHTPCKFSNFLRDKNICYLDQNDSEWGFIWSA